LKEVRSVPEHVGGDRDLVADDRLGAIAAAFQ
jgi:hypothetical protein